MSFKHLLLLTLLLSPWVSAKSYLAILIDDVGDNRERGMALLQLPKPVSIAIIPYRPFSIELAQAAQTHQRDVLLHMPMSNLSGSYSSEGLLTPQMSKEEFLAQAKANIEAIPGIVGINNHMGSEMTAVYPKMRWLMQQLYSRGLFFIDSRTTVATEAEQAAKDSGVASDRRSVFLDNDDDWDHINGQLDKAVTAARTQGFAIAIGHPRAQTIAVLQRRLTDWRDDVEVVSLSHFMALKESR